MIENSAWCNYNDIFGKDIHISFFFRECFIITFHIHAPDTAEKGLRSPLIYYLNTK